MDRTSRRLQRFFIATAAGLTLAGGLPGTAQAQDAPAIPIKEYVLIGVSVRSQPAYDGSISQDVRPIPVLRYYGQHWFARTSQGMLEGGVRRSVRPGLAIGAQVAYEPGRRATDSAFLGANHVSDVAPWASIGAHIE